MALQMIASLYTQANDLVSAEKYYKQAADLYVGDARLEMILLNNRGNVLPKLDQPRRAEAESRKALALARKEKYANLPQMLTHLARARIDQREFKGADAAIAEAMQILRGDPSPRAEAAALAVGAESARLQGDLARASRLIERSFAGVDLAETSFALRDAHITAYHVFRALGRNGLALAHLERVRTLGDDAAALATSASPALMAARFAYAHPDLRLAHPQPQAPPPPPIRTPGPAPPPASAAPQHSPASPPRRLPICHLRLHPTPYPPRSYRQCDS